MNNIDALYHTCNTIGEFAKGYTDYVLSVLRSTDFTVLEKIEFQFEEARAAGRTIFIAGNGGSATTASSMANDLGFDIIKKSQTELPLRVLSLTDNNSVMTAIANDVGYENLFVNQLKIHFREGDKLLVISASGNSLNLVKAVEWVKSKGGTAIALLGFDGGKLKQLCDLSLHINTLAGEYGPVEDAHLMVNHIFAHWFQLRFKKIETQPRIS